MKRNLLNHDDLAPFLKLLSEEHKEYAPYINSTVKNYIIRKGPTVRHWFFRFKNKNEQEEKIYSNGGPFYFLILDDDLKQRVSHVVDYLRAHEFRGITSISFEDAEKQHKDWIKKMNSAKDIQVDPNAGVIKEHTFEDGYKVVRLSTPESYRAEGKKMHHCVGSYSEKSSSIYSLRNTQDQSLVTFEAKNGVIGQRVENSNRRLSDVYKTYLNEFAEIKGFKFHEYSGGELNISMIDIMVPGIATFMTFKYKELFKWFGFEFPSSGYAATGISIALAMFAFMKWIDYFSNFGTRKGSSRIVDKI